MTQEIVGTADSLLRKAIEYVYAKEFVENRPSFARSVITRRKLTNLWATGRRGRRGDYILCVIILVLDTVALTSTSEAHNDLGTLIPIMNFIKGRECTGVYIADPI
jgi:hypothetical protein